MSNFKFKAGKILIISWNFFNNISNLRYPAFSLIYYFKKEIYLFIIIQKENKIN